MNDCTVVLLPGLDGTGALFQPLLSVLPAHIHPRVVAYPGDRQLGYGDLLPLVLAALPVQTPFILLGESFSGPLALMAAATRPAGLRGVVLSASFIRCPVPAPPALADLVVRPWQFRLWAAMAGVRMLMAGHSTPELRSLIRESLSQVRPEVIAHRVRAVVRVDATRELNQCPVPVLYLRGQHDRLVPSRNARAIQALRPGVTVESFAAPHQLLQAQPGHAAVVIAAFADRLCAAPASGSAADP